MTIEIDATGSFEKVADKLAIFDDKTNKTLKDSAKAMDMICDSINGKGGTDGKDTG